MYPLFAAASICAVLSACGGSDDAEKTDEVFFTGTFQPAQYYNFLNECTQNMRNGRTVSYNVKGEVIREELCSFDAATNIQKVTAKRLKEGVLAVADYTELTFNAQGSVVEAKTWSDAEKKSIRQEFVFTYAGDGRLLRSVETSETSKSVTTTEYGPDEVPAKTTTVTTLGGNTTTEVSTCVTFFSNYRPCERTKDGKVEETMSLEGEDYVRKQLVNDQLVEVERFSFLSPNTYPYKKRSYKYYGFDGELQFELSESCAGDEQFVNCSEIRKTADGTEFSSLSTVRENVGMVKNIVGGLERIYPAWIEKSGTYSAQDADKEYKGSFAATFDVATFNRDAEIKFEFKKSPRPELKEIFVATPYWSDMSDSLEDMFAEDLPDGSASFKAVSRHAGQTREILNEITGLTGLTSDQVNPSFVFKTEYIYQ